jgi:hypothetical protein
MARQRYRGARALLNRPGFHSTGAIVAEIEDTSGWRKGRDRDGKKITEDSWITPEMSFQISDCTRSIAFCLDLETAAGRENSLYKVDTLIDALTEFREALVDEQALFVERRRAAKKK